jgi:predicted site-specific integrase-resolvase
MATSIRDLKKELRYTFEELIEQVLLLQAAAGKAEEKNNKLINDLIEAYDKFISKINAHRSHKDKKAYFKELHAEINKEIKEFQEKINAL